MKTSSSSVVVVVIMIVLALGYAIYTTKPSETAIDLKVSELAGSAKKINVSVLDSDDVKTLKDLKVFGGRPIDPSADAISRRNPFDGI